jgi:hypothetical protein
MKIKAILWLAVGIIILIAALNAWHSARTKRDRLDQMLALSLSAGADLVHSTNSCALIGVTPELQSDLESIHTSPTQATISPGDDAAPTGDGDAFARLVLTNSVGQTLTLRLRPEKELGTGLQKYRVLGHYMTKPR